MGEMRRSGVLGGQRTVWVEDLECRQLLSIAPLAGPVMLPASAGTKLSAPAQPAGYTPAQMRHTYGFDQIAFAGSTAKADGSGQTIAVVGAYNQPNILSDLARFDAQYGLADPPSFTVVNQSGGTRLPATSSDWALETSLDVEWAHAIAPAASILLVEANSNNMSDLMAAVNYARNAAGVSVVSMSWGGSEYRGQTSYDSYFTTPAGHGGVTFVAASGDEGAAGGAEYPASSPNVLSVGGTTLSVADAAGTYSGETGWRSSSGGSSIYESEPAFQRSAQSTGRRTTPDVAYNASTSSGVAVYCSIRDSSGVSGWAQVGGTSAGAPQWAGLIAIANQARALAGQKPLDGATVTLPALYGQYSAPGSAGYAAYVATFHDITSGKSSTTVSATAGYDLVTGLGTPQAKQVVAALLSGAPASVQLQQPPAPTPTPTPKPYWPGRRWVSAERRSSATRSSPFSTVPLAGLTPVTPAGIVTGRVASDVLAVDSGCWGQEPSSSPLVFQHK